LCDRLIYADAYLLSRIGKVQDGRHYLVQRDRCLDLMIGHPPQQRLNGLDVIDNAAELFGCLAVGVARSGRQPPAKTSSGALSRMMWSNCPWNCAWFSSQPAVALLSIWLLARWLISALECSRGDVRAVWCVPGGGRPVLRGLRRSFGGVPIMR
jgi:hypothetical protein